MSPGGIVVTGASRGIGEALAVALAAPGLTLALVGRDAARLAAVAETCRRRGASAETVLVDVRDRAALKAALISFDDRCPVDLVVANAGVALPADDDEAMADGSYGEAEVNYLGALNTVLPFVSRMTLRGRGQIVLVSSLAAFAPLPDSPGYSASKAALTVYGLALRERLRGRGIRVSVVCPGYVETDMGSRYRGRRPFLMSAEAAADRILHGLARNKPIIAFPRRLAFVARLATLVPERLRRVGLAGFRFSIDRERR